jgi:AcrR family transcriptional regulator
LTKLAKDRDTHLTPGEIAAEALRQFDVGTTDLSIRKLAAALRVAPSAIYHHFPSRAAVVRAAVDLVWEEATAEFLQQVPDPLTADPVEILVTSAIATRRAFGRHFRIAPYLAATPESSEFMTNTLGLMAVVFERMRLGGTRAGESFHTYASFTIGAVLFAATRRVANEQLAHETSAGTSLERYHTDGTSPNGHLASEETRRSLDEVMGVSIADPQRDEDLFAQGLRRLIQSFGN